MTVAVAEEEAADPPCETALMWSPVMTTVASGETEDVAGLISVTCVMTICRGGAGGLI